MPDPEAPGGWRWQRLDEYAAGLTADDYTAATWPSQQDQRQVYVHVVQTRVRKLYRCQVVIVRESLDAPVAQARYWASSDLAADLPALLTHLAARWEVEVLFGDAKELLGLDQYQLLSATAIVRFWTLVLAAYVCVEEEQARLRTACGGHVTLGAARAALQWTHYRHLLSWLHQQFRAGATPQALADQLAA